MSEHPSGEELLAALESGSVRAAYPENGGWVVPSWVKGGILEIFRNSAIVPTGIEVRAGDGLAFCDKDAFPVRRFDAASGVRLVPGGSSVRRGAHLGKGVVCMPPMYVNVGAFVGAGSMVDSHALVGSCAQIGEGVHLSAAAQIGGVLEPVGARPVIVEDGAFIGGGVGIYEGVLIGPNAVIAAGVVLTASTPVFDLVNETELCGSSEAPLSIPPGAVVISGTRPASGAFAQSKGLNLVCALIVKYRDAGTDAAVTLEQALRS
ncbi:MAG: 2,3,4,5-tetrahydropyridine-2,6-dicarboxylate N-succinyltransferase [bacterium]|nr:2,3,4,5-tetrahydropyridine-2,6-dicarboxylate N-succinyltransferase [bacterium]